MAQVVEFGVTRYADTIEQIQYLYGDAEILRRTNHLPPKFKADLVRELKHRKQQRTLPE